MATKDKKNHIKIKGEINQAIFKEFLAARNGFGIVLSDLERPQLDHIAKVATRAVMRDPNIDVVLKRKR